MQVKAIAKNVRVSPEKMRLVVDQIKKMSPSRAILVLDQVHKKSAPILKKVIMSAISNAKNNFGLTEESLKFDEILVGEGPSFKRYRAVARGRAHAILRRTSHIKIVLEGKLVESKAAVVAKKGENNKNA